MRSHKEKGIQLGDKMLSQNLTGTDLSLEQKINRKPKKFWTTRRVLYLVLGGAVISTYNTIVGIQNEDPMTFLPATTTALIYLAIVLAGARLYLESQSAPAKQYPRLYKLLYGSRAGADKDLQDQL